MSTTTFSNGVAAIKGIAVNDIGGYAKETFKLSHFVLQLGLGFIQVFTGNTTIAQAGKKGYNIGKTGGTRTYDEMFGTSKEG